MHLTGLKYLSSRNVEKQNIIDFNIGYCDDALKVSSFNFPEHVNVKSAKFKNSILIPVYDLYGKMLGVWSRRVDYKKINGSSWKKSEHLFGLNQTWQYCLDKTSVFIVEGPFDLIACWKYGHRNVVSVLGTAFSYSHACLLKRLVSKAYVLFDNDNAGIEAAKKCKKMLDLFEIENNILHLEEDPDDALHKNSNVLNQLTKRGL